MGPTNFIPPLRIEIRKKAGSKKAKIEAWSLLDTAQTETQAADKIRRAALPKDAETRIVPNVESHEIFSAPGAEQPETAAAGGETTLPAVGDILRDAHTGVAVKVIRLGGTYRSGKPREGFTWENLTTRPGDRDHLGFCPSESVGSFVKLSPEAVKLIEKMETAMSTKETATPTAASAVDAIVGSTPLPFGVGDTLRDVHTGVAVRVTAINGAYKSGKPRAGFAWENLSTQPGDKDHTGFCPLESVGCFEKVAKNAKPVAEPSGEEAPPPEVKPAAEKKPETDSKPDTATKPKRLRRKKPHAENPPAAHGKTAAPRAPESPVSGLRSPVSKHRVRTKKPAKRAK